MNQKNIYKRIEQFFMNVIFAHQMCERTLMVACA